MTQPPLPQPELEPQPINFEQYIAYTPDKLELSRGFYEYGGQEMTGFYLAVLRNMGLQTAVRHVSLSDWLKAFETLALESGKLNFDNEVNETMLNRFNRGMEALESVIDYIDNPTGE